MEQNFGYIGVTKYQMGVGRGFDREVVKWAAVDGGCLPALTARDKTIAPLMCKKSGCRRHLEALGFKIEVPLPKCALLQHQVSGKNWPSCCA